MNKISKKVIINSSYCDGFCERCFHCDNCGVFQERFEYEIKCVMQGKNPQEWSQIFDEIRKKLETIIKTETQEINNGYFKIVKLDKKEEKIKNIKKDDFFIKANILAQMINKFLNKIFSFSADERRQSSLLILKEDIENLIHYCHLIEIKIYESYWDKDKNITLKNIALGYFSLLVCEQAIKNFFDGFGEICSIESLFLLEKINEFKKEIIIKFPETLSYKDEIIFNTKV